MIERFEIDPTDKADLQKRYRVDGPMLRHTNFHFWSNLDGKSFGRMSMIVTGRRLCWNEFYPFDDTALTHHPELVGTGLGRLSHTLILARLVPLLNNPNQYNISYQYRTEPAADMLKRMGNHDALKGYMPLKEYAMNALANCQKIGFALDEQLEFLRHCFRNTMD